MKKTSILLLLAAAVVVSCKKDNLGADAVENDGSVISAVIDDDNNSGKTTLDGVKVLWVSGDAIAINKKQYSATPDATDARKATFTIFMASAPTDAPFCAYYPYSDNRTTAKGQFSLPTTQYYSTKSPLGSSPMYAESESLDGTFHFKNVCGLLTLDLKGEGTVSKIDVSANENLAGTLTNVAINDSGELTYGDFLSTGASRTVSLSCGSAVTLNKEAARRFYIALPEGDFTGVKLSVTTDAGTVVFPATKTVSIKKNNIYHLPEMTVEVIPLEFNADLSIDKCETTSPISVDLAVSIKPEDKDVYYIPAVESASYVSKFEDALALARADMAYWKGEGAKSLNQLINAGLAIKGDDLEDTQFDYCTPGTDYVFYVYAVDENLNVSPAVELPFTTPKPVSDAKYEDYLGQWVMGTSIVTIAEKTNGSSYNITGLKYQNGYNSTFKYNVEAIVANFEDGYIVLKEQNTGATTTVPDDGVCDIYLSGGFTQSGRTYGHYPFNAGSAGPQIIFWGEYEDGGITVYGGECKYGDFDSMGFTLRIREGEDAGNGYFFRGDLIDDMTEYVEPVGPTPEGKWYCASVTDYWGEEYTDWTLDIAKEGAGYAIDNFDIGFDTFLSSVPLKAMPATATWDPESLTLTVADKTSTGISAGSLITWRGINGGYYSDIVLKFDFEANTCTLQTGFLSTAGSGAYSRYNAGVVFTKVDADAAPKSNVAGNKAAGHFEGMDADFHYSQIQSASSIAKVQKPIKADSARKSFRNIR